MNAATRVDLMDLLGPTREDPLWEAEKSGWAASSWATTDAIIAEGASSARLGSPAMMQPHDRPILSAGCSDQGPVHRGEGAFGLLIR